MSFTMVSSFKVCNFDMFPKRQKKNMKRAGREIFWLIKGVTYTDFQKPFKLQSCKKYLEQASNLTIHVKRHTTGKVLYLNFRNFVVLFTKSAFWEKDWILGYDSMSLCYFLISLGCK